MTSKKYPATWNLKGARTGCSNWKEIQLERKAVIEMSAGACGLRCHRRPNCTSFNFQPSPCSGKEMVAKGACLLFGGVCEEENNSCWDLYRKVDLVTQLKERTDAGKTVLHIDSAAGFNV